MTNRDKAIKLLDKIKDKHWVRDEDILNFIIQDYLSEDEALKVLQEYLKDIEAQASFCILKYNKKINNINLKNKV